MLDAYTFEYIIAVNCLVFIQIIFIILNITCNAFVKVS